MKQCMSSREQIANLMTRVICGAALAFASSGVLASLVCERPQNALEKKLCSYTWNDTGYTFEDLDVNLNLTYQAALDRVPDREKLRIEQRAWLKVRDKCEDAKCFNDTYDARIRELAAIPGKSAANAINFFGTEHEIDIDPKLYKPMQLKLLSRSGGLKYFDGGANDFDIVGEFMSVGQINTAVTTCSYRLFGTGKTFSSSCQNPTNTSGLQLKFTPLPGDRDEGRDGWGNVNQSKTLTAKGIELNIYSLATSCEPFEYYLFASSAKTNKVLWSWTYFYETLEESKCWMSKKNPSVLLKFRDSNSYIGSPLLLPGGDILVGRIRIDPESGLPRDRSRVAAISIEQANQIKRQLRNDYLATNPTCKAKPETCPDPGIQIQYMWQQLASAIKPFYLPAK